MQMAQGCFVICSPFKCNPFHGDLLWCITPNENDVEEIFSNEPEVRIDVSIDKSIRDKNKHTGVYTNVRLRRKIESALNMKLGNEKFSEGDLSGAMQFYQAAIFLNESNANGWINLAMVNHQSGFFDLSIQRYKKAITLDPSNETAYYNLGIVYHELSMFCDAISMYRSALICNPNHEDAKFNLDVLLRAIEK